jgi:cytochrome P450
MARYPKVQAEAQQEIDAIVGRDRLPAFEDREKLPYVEAMVMEILRWQPVLPLGRHPDELLNVWFRAHLYLGLPHRTTEDDIWDGYWIPKGAAVLPNVWFCRHLYTPASRY